MAQNRSKSLREMSRSLGVEDGEYEQFRKAVLKHLDKKSGSQKSTMALKSSSIDFYLESFIDGPVAKQYAKILRGLNSPHSQIYDKAMLILRELTYGWVRNLNKKKHPCRKSTIGTSVSNSDSTIISPEHEEDTIQVQQPELETRSVSASRVEPSNSTILRASGRDEIIRPDTPEIAIIADKDVDISPSRPQNRVPSPSNRLWFENDNVPYTRHPTNRKRTYDDMIPDDRIPQDLVEQTEEQTDDEDNEDNEQHRQEVMAARAGKRVRYDEPESSPMLQSETPARITVLSSVPRSARDLPFPIDQAQSSTGELKIWLDIFLLTIRERRRFVEERAETEHWSADGERMLRNALKSFDDLHSDLLNIVASVSPRLG